MLARTVHARPNDTRLLATCQIRQAIDGTLSRLVLTSLLTTARAHWNEEHAEMDILALVLYHWTEAR